MSEVLALESPLYEEVPADLFELADREEDGKKLVLYGGRIALLDVIKVGDAEVPDYLLLRIESTPDKAMDLFNHPALYAPAEAAKSVFDRAA